MFVIYSRSKTEETVQQTNVHVIRVYFVIEDSALVSFPLLTVAALSSQSLSLSPPRSVMLWPTFAFNYIKFSHVTLLPLPGQSSCLHIKPTADTGLQGWLNRNYTHLAPGHGSTRTAHKAATEHLTHPPLQLSVSVASVLGKCPNMNAMLRTAMLNSLIKHIYFPNFPT